MYKENYQSELIPGLIRLPLACQMLGRSRNGLLLLQKKYPDFPKPIKFGISRQAAVYFDVAELREWINKHKSAGAAP